ncbi:MAG: molybdenum cofactor biosynthesis protein MoaE [Terriglobales bacterium]
MRVRVLFFGMLKDLAGGANDALELPAGATVGDLLSHYGQRPRLGDLLRSVAVSVNQEYARPDAPLHDNDEVALLPPVSGGSSEAQVRQRTRLVRERIETQAIVEALKQPSDGAVVMFDGIVRDNSRGRRTLFLDYEAYESMAARKLEELASEARAKFAISDVTIVHRLGRLEIGESSVVIAVAAPHRGAAFDACRWIIDTLKKTVPIWKKEHFADGAVWADGDPFPPEIRASEPSKAQ